MKKLYILVGFILFVNFIYGQFSEGSHPTQATLMQENPYVETIYLKPLTTVSTPVSVNIVFAVSIPFIVPEPSNPSAVSLIGASITINPRETINGRYVYSFIIEGDANTSLLSTGLGTPIATVTFPVSTTGNIVQLNDYRAFDTDWCQFYVSYNGSVNVNYSTMFFGDGAVNNWPSGDSYVSSSGTLPIILNNFNARKYSETTSLLNWTTSSETNSSYFGIERSLNGNRWENIGRVSAAGTSRTEKAYRYFDDKLPRFTSSSQEVYYRLKMYDRDGRFQYSEIRSVLFEKEEGFIHIYPNPATQKTYIDLSGIEHNGEDMELTVMDMNGSLVMRKTFKATDLELVQIDQLPANTYQILVKHGEQIYQQRLVKVD